MQSMNVISKPTFLSALVPSTETSCLVVGSMIAILFLSLVRVDVWLGGPEAQAKNFATMIHRHTAAPCRVCRCAIQGIWR